MLFVSSTQTSQQVLALAAHDDRTQLSQVLAEPIVF